MTEGALRAPPKIETELTPVTGHAETNDFCKINDVRYGFRAGTATSRLSIAAIADETRAKLRCLGSQFDDIRIDVSQFRLQDATERIELFFQSQITKSFRIPIPCCKSNILDG